MNSMDQESRYNADKHIEKLDDEYAMANNTSIASVEANSSKSQPFSQIEIQQGEDQEGIPEEFRNFKSIHPYYYDNEDIHKQINSSLGLDIDYKTGSRSGMNHLRENKSNERTRKKIEHFDNTIYDQ